MTMNKVIFVHILKCGGTSLRYMLLDELGYIAIAPVPVGEARGDYEYPYTNDDPLVYQQSITPAMVELYSVVMSHYDIRIANRLPEWDVITMLRNPVHQLHSLYKFIQHLPQLREMHPDHQSMSFKDWLLSDKCKPYLNTQTRYLSGHGTESLEIALAWLDSPRMHFGILEKYSESVRRWNDKFGWSMSVEHLNKIVERPITEEEYDIAESLQTNDMKLYAKASYLFNPKFSLLGGDDELEANK